MRPVTYELNKRPTSNQQLNKDYYYEQPLVVPQLVHT